MIVLDASAAIELILGTPRGDLVLARLQAPGVTLHAPALIDIEVAQVLRRFERVGSLDASRAQHALADFRDLGIEHYEHDLLLDRIWELRPNLTAYDASYVALAELLGAALVTFDERIQRAPGHQARVQVPA